MEKKRDDEIVINLRDLFFAVLKGWRMVLLTTFICAVLFGGYKGIQAYQQYSNADARQKADAAYDFAQSQYETAKDSLEIQLARLNEEIDDQNAYKDESILMNINPYDVYVSTVTLYVSTDYQIMPGMTYQNKDYAGSILRLYTNIIQNGEMADSILEKSGSEKMISKNLDELISVGLDTDNNIITVKVKSNTQELTEMLMSDICSELQERQPSISNMIGSFELSIMVEPTVNTVDSGILDKQITFDKNMADLQNKVADVQKKLDALSKPSDTRITKKSVLNGTIKFLIVGALLGGFLSAGLICTKYVLEDMLHTNSELEDRTGMRILASLYEEPKKRAFSSVDHLIQRLEGIQAAEREEAFVCELAAANIQSFAGTAERILIAGETSAARIKEISRELSSKLLSHSMTSGGSLVSDAATIQDLGKCDAVVLVLQRNVSRHSDIRKSIEITESLQKPIIGALVIDK